MAKDDPLVPLTFKISCALCEKEDVAIFYTHELLAEFVHQTPPGWILGVKIKHGYDPGDEELRIRHEETFCSEHCLRVSIDERIEERRLREADEARKRSEAAQNRIIDAAAKLRGLAALHAEYGEDLHAAVADGRLVDPTPPRKPGIDYAVAYAIAASGGLGFAIGRKPEP